MNRVFHVEIIQPKFDELYKKYRKLNDGDYKLFDEEKERIKNIAVANQHRLARDKWLNIKRILDAIYKSIFPFVVEKKIDGNSTILLKEDIELYNRNLGQKIFLDPNSLPPEQQIFFEPALRHLLGIGAISYENYEYMIATSKPFRNFLKGNILVKDRNIFEEYHKKISEFVDFIQEDGKIRFPEAYNKPTLKEVEIKPKVEPIPIKIVGDVGIRGFEEKVIVQKSKNKRIQLRKFPADLRWEDISIQFLNGQEVIIKIKTKAKEDVYQTTYEEMGFMDEKRRLPNKQWEFLEGLSKIGGELSWESPRATARGKKQKQLLADVLKTYFQLTDDPFYPYKKEKSYKIKINLIPEADSGNGQGKRVTLEDEDDDLGASDYLKEEAPEIYKK